MHCSDLFLPRLTLLISVPVISIIAVVTIVTVVTIASLPFAIIAVLLLSLTIVFSPWFALVVVFPPVIFATSVVTGCIIEIVTLTWRTRAGAVVLTHDLMIRERYKRYR
jgi:hypothetical protein